MIEDKEDRRHKAEKQQDGTDRASESMTIRRHRWKRHLCSMADTTSTLDSDPRFYRGNTALKEMPRSTPNLTHTPLRQGNKVPATTTTICTD
ncbi:hypothetical protein E2C01_068099 [Portunus trituberculatus]|uniref:Uncharacterized protein n=1 Tax=Portunus trituberculatus TaxID=210409 RepID=A0A5B7HR36_PORTR|nr:hypothetical protein [Portunus trituberculatus]